MTYDDFLFYLPGYASIPLILAGLLAGWLAWRLLRSRKAVPRPETPKKTGFPAPPKGG
jgi:hypothetical protein